MNILKRRAQEKIEMSSAFLAELISIIILSLVIFLYNPPPAVSSPVHFHEQPL